MADAEFQWSAYAKDAVYAHYVCLCLEGRSACDTIRVGKHVYHANPALAWEDGLEPRSGDTSQH